MSTANADRQSDEHLRQPWAGRVQTELERLRAQRRPRYEQLWRYYRQAGSSDRLGAGAAPGPKGGLPVRLRPAAERRLNATEAPERVIENDIAWRIHGMVDFMVSRPPTIQSLVADPRRADAIERFLHRVIEDNGGQAFFHALALIGHIYGFVDTALRVDAEPDRPIAFDLIDAQASLPITNPNDYTDLLAYGICGDRVSAHTTQPSWLDRLRNGFCRTPDHLGESTHRIELLSDDTVQLLEPRRHGGFRVVASDPNPLGVLPVVHIQNLHQPFAYEGLGEIEPLIGLQDELNTRLSDRAHRVTLQSFQMYLAKGIDGFADRPVAPGQMWTTDNPDASIQAFGGDASSPSEESHIREVREALDKASAISPLVTGQVRDRLGNLSSENALRIVTMGLVARTDKKRFAYGQGIRRLAGLALRAADLIGLFPNTPEERRLHIDWPDPMPLGQTDQLRNAQLKLELGVPRRRVLAELGYTAAELSDDTDKLSPSTATEEATR
ncbi:MAG: phage portal protein [Planctomycetota bacterium]